MSGKRYSPEEIISKLREAEVYLAGGVKVGEVIRRLGHMRHIGIRDRPTAPHSPWQNGLSERITGSIRRECLDHIIVFGEAHLRRVMRAYVKYYNNARTHLSLEKISPVERNIQNVGAISSIKHIGGLHHEYSRI